MNLPDLLLQALKQLNYTKPTPIQAKTIPIAINNIDILGSAPTGTGKTLSFVIPIIAHLLRNPDGAALVLTPTRELSVQVITVIKQFNKYKLNFKSSLLIGGEPIYRQISQLKAKPKIIVGTPGRVLDHLARKTISSKYSFLVLDETDRMFDMGFGIQLENIMQQISKNKQSLMFSATLPKGIEKLANKYLHKPQRVSITPKVKLVTKLTEETIMLKQAEKFNNLVEQLKSRHGTIIVFVNTKLNAQRLTTSLRQQSLKAAAMHGDLKQSMRGRVIRNFHNQTYRIMVATDIAARGLDIPHIQHVINYDLPHCPADYVHRVGRTARAGATGAALNLVSSHDKSKWNIIKKFISGKHDGSNTTISLKKSKSSKNFRNSKNFKSPGGSKGSRNSKKFIKFKNSNNTRPKKINRHK